MNNRIIPIAGSYEIYEEKRRKKRKKNMRKNGLVIINIDGTIRCNVQVIVNN